MKDKKWKNDGLKRNAYLKKKWIQKIQKNNNKMKFPEREPDLV